MFERLETIDWSRLETAYGLAESIPDVVRNLASPDEETRGAAWQTFWSELEHQGTLYQPSAYAAPFLVRWLPQTQTDEKSSLVTFLARLARGNSYKHQHLNLTTNCISVLNSVNWTGNPVELIKMIPTALIKSR